MWWRALNTYDIGAVCGSHFITPPTSIPALRIEKSRAAHWVKLKLSSKWKRDVELKFRLASGLKIEGPSVQDFLLYDSILSGIQRGIASPPYINVLRELKSQAGLPNKKWTPVIEKLPLPQAQGFRGSPLPSSRRQRRAVACEPTLTARGFQGLDPVI